MEAGVGLEPGPAGAQIPAACGHGVAQLVQVGEGAVGHRLVDQRPEPLGRLQLGAPVNLERAVTPVTRLGGHIVQGHVDGRGQFLAVEDHGESWTLRIKYPPEIARYLVFKGSVAVEGISLTIAGLTDEYFEIAIIPKTWEVTNLSRLKPGDGVNLEVDVIGKYVERLLAFG